MYKKLILSAVMAMPFVVQAQNAKVLNAYNYLNNYNKEKSIDDLRNAKQNIDEAILNEGTKAKPKTWFYRGNVYMTIFASELKQEVPDALKQAAEAYAQVYALDSKYEYAEEAYRFAVMSYKNVGILAFNANNFPEALASFEQVIKLSSQKGNTDKEAVENAAISAMRAKEYDKAISYYQQYIGFNTDTNGVQHFQLYKAMLAKGDTTSGVAFLKESRLKYAKNNELLIEELRYYLAEEKNAEAEALLKQAIASDPKNYTLYLAAGSTYEKQNKRKEALEAYQKAIELKPETWEAYYNIGANYNNEGRRLQELANEEKDPKKYDAGIKLADEELKKALENLEKARQFVPAGKDRSDVLNALKQLYGRLNMPEKYNEVKKELENKN
ncbi:MAG: tetratricopeptide repeat protein [Bacteroidia bacterium]|nr:tetratricopeptide repeat protein [Bacteroidia bacterium]MCC6769208.1 tetratricopeptide repeat protein [Bacteroidia bacterium]